MAKEMLDIITSLIKKARIVNWLLILLPCLVFILHACLFGAWINDDAGISFSYARNLARGHGLVSQPGNVPVEGYSNFLWILFLTPFFSLGIFHPVIIPKLLGMLMVIISFVILRKGLFTLSDNSKFITFAILMLIAVNTSFAVWLISGLENSLYVMLISLLLLRSVQGIIFGKTGVPDAIILGVLAGAIALTRPDGVIFFCAYPLLLAIKWPDRQKRLCGSEFANLSIYALSFTILFGGYLLFRLVYFHDLFPNTYHAKGGELLGNFISILTLRSKMLIKTQDIFYSVGGRFGNILLAGLVIITIYLILIKGFRRKHFLLLVFLSLSFLTYLLLPYEPIGEYRYNTVFFIFLYSYMVIITNLFIKSLNIKNSLRTSLAVLIMLILTAGSVFLFSRRSIEFARRPPVPFDFVSRRFGERFNQYADRLGIQGGSLLLPDAGGTLFYSRLRVYDLAGLCDRTIAKTFRKNRSQEAFYEYIFETVRPTFIHTHGIWTYLAALDKDKRFRQNYIPVYEYPDAWVKNNFGPIMYSGDYVRKDAVTGKAKELGRLRNEFKNDFEIGGKL